MFLTALLVLSLRLVSGTSVAYNTPRRWSRDHVWTQLLCSSFANRGFVSHLQCSNANTSVIQWGPCDTNLGIDPSLSCASFVVPLDYHNASVGTAKLALIKANATATRRGTMFLNPGGPGASGIQTINSTSATVLNITGGEYDIVSWDPRGVGSLTVPGDVHCFDGLDEYNAFWNGTIELNGIEMTGNFTNQTDIDRLMSQAPLMQNKYEELGQRCLNHSDGQFLQYVGTAATARDMVAMADALDGAGAPVNYWGQSYGTLIGSWFINIVQRVGHVILDGVVDPVGFATEEIALAWSTQIVDDDHAFEGFYTGCALAGSEHCAIAAAGQSPLEVNDNIQALLQTAHDVTIRGSGSVPVTSGIIRSTLRPEIYFPTGWADVANTQWPIFVQGVQQETGVTTNGTENVSVSTPRSSFTRRAEQDTPPYSTQAILCGDSIDLTNTSMSDVFQNIITTAQNTSHMFAAAWPLAPYYCATWPVRAVERYQGPFNNTLANPILIIGNTFDPATPFASAKKLSEVLGDQARLVRLNTFGHTSSAAPSQCINGIIRAYMTNGTLPVDNNGICEVDLDFEIFTGVTIERTMANLPDHSGTL
ncbi:TAP-like protein-domain-containing protein [Lenzites betulinus]|nr:TAP-like protein-domain-containing protein [Lenzites betulinus]